MKRQYDILICTPFLDKDKDLDLYKESIQLGDGKGWGHWQGARDKAKAKEGQSEKGFLARNSEKENIPEILRGFSANNDYISGNQGPMLFVGNFN